MLKIIVNNTTLDLSEDISIPLVFSNPIFEDSSIPTPHSLNFTLPTTPTNLSLFGYSNRAASITDLSQKYLTIIYFDGREVVSGNLIINQIDELEIDVQLLCATFIDTLKKKLHQVEIDSMFFGYMSWYDGDNFTEPGYYPSNEAVAAHDTWWESALSRPLPNYVAAPLSIGDIDWLEYGRRSIINILMFPSLTQGAVRIWPLIPAIRVAYIFEKICPGLGSVFNSPELEKLMLACYYHPKYRGVHKERNSDYRIWDTDKESLSISLKTQDFLPDVDTGTFVAQMLMMIGASLYVVNGEPVVAYNNDILSSTVNDDWRDKISGIASVTVEGAQKFRFTLGAAAHSNVQIDEEVKEYDNMEAMVIGRAAADVTLCRTLDNGQVFESEINDTISTDVHNHYSFKLMQDSECSSGADDSDDDVRELACQVLPVRCIVTENPLSPSVDGEIAYAYFYCPEVPDCEKVRPTEIIVGQYGGTRFSPPDRAHTYPSITATGNGASVSLVNDGLYNAYHTKYAQWVATPRRTIKGNALLNVGGIKSLDLRRKIHYEGRNFLIRNINITLNFSSIDLADFDAVEA